MGRIREVALSETANQMHIRAMRKIGDFNAGACGRAGLFSSDDWLNAQKVSFVLHKDYQLFGVKSCWFVGTESFRRVLIPYSLLPLHMVCMYTDGKLFVKKRKEISFQEHVDKTLHLVADR
jgi:hypothetical protein